MKISITVDIEVDHLVTAGGTIKRVAYSIANAVDRADKVQPNSRG